ncbi:hypothetical protein COLO4_33385 [Corchorus olitorius]|uniref:Uncharacterized protein n=1 Tax=Corchorus olitorius TaxID=93759 RepID=A0A1R3GUC7_9ROSI|nr:hypothetical protein COLO4_33385 [Corchorus olitorius]
MEEFEREREGTRLGDCSFRERVQKTKSCCVRKGAIEGVLAERWQSGVSSVYIERWEERENSDGLCEGENGRVDSCLESEREDESKVVEKGTVKSIWKGSGWR